MPSLFQMTNCWNYSPLLIICSSCFFAASIIPSLWSLPTLCCSPPPVLSKEVDILKAKHERKQEETTSKSLLLPTLSSADSFKASNMTSLFATWGMLPCFWKEEEREGATWTSILCPFSISVCRQRYQHTKLEKCLVFTGSNVWERKKGDLNSISTQVSLQVFCMGLNLTVNFKKNLTKQNFTPSSQ